MRLDTFKQYELFKLTTKFNFNVEFILLFTTDEELVEILDLTNGIEELSVDDYIYKLDFILKDYFDSFLNAILHNKHPLHIQYPSEKSNKVYAVMQDDLGYLLRPVREGMIQYMELYTGDIKMYDIKLLNDYIDVSQFNEYLSNTS